MAFGPSIAQLGDHPGRVRRSASFVGLSLVASAALSAAWGEDAPSLPARLTAAAGTKMRARIEIALASSFRSREHRLRSLDDDATILASLDLDVKEPRGELALVEASFRSFDVARHFRARISGFFADSEREGRGATSWREGEPDPPPGFRALLAPRGFLLADASPVTSDGARWIGERWLDPRDERSHEDAKIRRLARYVGLGTLLGAPALPEGRARAFEAALPLWIGESGLTNAFVELEAVFALETGPGQGGLVRVHGKLARVRLVRGDEPRSHRVDSWLDLAFARGGPSAEGELDASFDPARGRFREVRSRVALAHEGEFDGGRGRATFERRVTAREE
jgi:hypothetical protein